MSSKCGCPINLADKDDDINADDIDAYLHLVNEVYY